MKAHHSGTSIATIEPLEARIAPAGVMVVDAKTATWTDVDGDLVTLKLSKPVMGQIVFTEIALQPGDFGQQVALIDLTNIGAANKGVSLTFTAKRQDALLDGVNDGIKDGDGSVNIGRIDATGIDLGTVKLPGDLGAITAGDNALTTPALASIIVTSAGALGAATQAGDTPNLNWSFRGRIGAVTVKGDFFAALDVLDDSEPLAFNKDASSGPITIWGDLVGGDDSLSSNEGIGTGYLFAEGNLGPVKILGEIFGGSTSFGGSVTALGAIPSVTLGGNLFAGAAEDTGEISGLLGTVKIAGSIIGGDVQNTGIVTSFGALTSVNVGGGIFGGDETNTGNVFAFGPLGKVTVLGSVIGGDSPRDVDGNLLPDGDVSYVIENSGAIGSSVSIGSVTIGLDLVAGKGRFSGAVFTQEPSGGNIKSVTIGGTLEGFSFIDDGTGAFLRVATGIYADGQLGTVKVGAISGDDPSNAAAIVALGKANPATASKALAIASVTVLRGAASAEILAGFDSSGNALNPDVQIGTIKIANNLIGTSISAGVPFTGAGFGDADNAIVAANTDFGDNLAIPSRIASLIVGGYVLGNPFAAMDFVNGAVAQEIGSVKIGGVALELTKGTALEVFQLGVTHGFFVREVA